LARRFRERETSVMNALPTSESPDCHDVLGTRLHEGVPNAQLLARLAPFWAEHVSLGQPSLTDGHRDAFGIKGIVLAAGG
jgi:hypothetical protein